MTLTYIGSPLSESTNGRMIEVNAVASPGTPVHTVVATDELEEIEIYAANAGAHAAELTIELGGTGTADHVVDVVEARNGCHQMVPGLLFTATDTTIRAFATATGLFHIGGSVRPAT